MKVDLRLHGNTKCESFKEEKLTFKDKLYFQFHVRLALHEIAFG